MTASSTRSRFTGGSQKLMGAFVQDIISVDPKFQVTLSARIDHWLKELAPSDGLRKWFHSSANWAIFKKRYFKELNTPEASADLEKLYGLLFEYEQVTLVYASKDSERNNAVALKELLDGMKKPPSSSGPARAMAVPRRMAKRRSS